MNYLRLVHFELRRVMPLFLGLIGFYVLVQAVVLFFYQQNLYSLLEEELRRGFSIEQFVYQYGPISIASLALNTSFYLAPFFIAFSILGGYSFIIWYREWFGKHSFIYRLLLLPLNRMTVYFAKFTTIVIMALTVCAVQIATIPFHEFLLTIRLPEQVVDKASTFSNLFSTNWFANPLVDSILIFSIASSLLLLFLTTAFSMVLLERSYRIKGVIYAVLFAGFIAISYFGSLFIMEGNIYYSELYIAGLGLSIVLISANISVSWCLLTRKISV